MRKVRRFAFALGLSGLVAMSIVTAGPAGAAGPNSGCKTTVTQGGQISTYPAWGGSASAMRLACLFEHDTAHNDVASAFTIHDFSNILWHNGAGRTVTPTAPTTNSTTFTATNCTGLTGYVNHTLGYHVQNPPFFFGDRFVTAVDPDCTVHLNAPMSVSPSVPPVIDNAPGPRTIDNGELLGDAVMSPAANFTSADVGLSLTGTNVPTGSVITSVESPTKAHFSHTVGTDLTQQVVSLGATYQATSTRNVGDATYPVGGNLITSTDARFSATTDIGLPVYDILGTTLGYVVNVIGNTAVIGPGTPLTPDSSTHLVTIGDPTASAPYDGDSFGEVNLQVQLDPDAVSTFGSQNVRPCSENVLGSLHLQLRWFNPGPNDLFTVPGGSVIGVIGFQSPVLKSIIGTVVQKPQSSPGDPIGAVHYDIVLSTGLGLGLFMCAPTASSPAPSMSFGVSSTASGQTEGEAGTRPGTGQLRLVKDNNQTGSATTAYLTSEDPAVAYTGSNFNRICVIPAGSPTGVFKCGTG